MKLLPNILVALTFLHFALSFPSPPVSNGATEYYEDNIDERGPYFEGDMVIDESDLVESKAGIKDPKKRWPNNQVVYTISSGFSSNDRSTIEKAINMISSKTCITFKERSNEKDYVSVENTKSGCFSAIGRKGGKQSLNLGRGCVTKGIPAHEFIHAIGFHHEQSRTDRDDYVTINWSNIEKSHTHNFDKYGADRVSPFGVSYDYGSIMHYSRGAFAKDRSQPTIIAKDSEARIGQRDGLSAKDAEKIDNMYGC